METLPPIAVAEPRFPLRALALAASRAPLGGVRETLLATLVAARLAAGAVGPSALPAPLRAERAAAARHWLGALSLSAAIRGALTQLLESTALEQPAGMGAALEKVIEVTAPQLDRKARSELDRLARTIGA